jgi:hypothetical protein
MKNTIHQGSGKRAIAWSPKAKQKIRGRKLPRLRRDPAADLKARYAPRRRTPSV